MAQSKDVRLVTESKLDVSNAGLKAGVAADLAPIKNDVADLKVMGGLNPGSPNDASTSNFIETPGTLTHTALSAAIGESIEPVEQSLTVKAPATLPEAGPLLAKLHRRQSDAVLLVLGDSTGQGDFDLSKRWPLLLAEKLAVQFPAYTVRFHMWNGSYLGGLHAYDAPVTLSTGTSARVLDIYNQSASGTTATYSVEHFAAATPKTPDAVIISHGHNHPLSGFIAGYTALVKTVRRAFPRVPIILTAQNPRRKVSAGYADQLKIRELITNYAAREGHGFIDATTLFEEHADYETVLMSDETHPSPEGYESWGQHVANLFNPAPSAVGVRQHRPKLDRLWYPAAAFVPSAGAPVMTMAAAARPVSGWALDPAAAESVNTMVDIPEDWESLDMSLFWSTAADGTGVVMWNAIVFPALQTSLLPTATYPVTAASMTQTTMGISRQSESVAAGEAEALRRMFYDGTSTNAYTRRGLHGLRIQRFANHATDTLNVDAVFVGCLFERVA